MLRYSKSDRFPGGNCYTTPAGRSRWFARRFPGLTFYPCLANLVLRASIMAKRGRLTDEALVSSCAGVFSLCEAVGMRFRIENLSAVQNLKTPCVIVANHMSTLETFTLPCLLGSYLRTTFVVKESLLRVPIFGPILRTRDPIAVGRRSPRDDLKQMLKVGGNRLEMGISLIVFPQTSRRPDVDRGSFNSIGIKLARRNGVPVVPLALRTDAWGNGKILKDIGPIHPERDVNMCFADPISVEGRGRSEHITVVDFIVGKLEEWEEMNGGR